jgi:hypothetical protein
VEIIRKGHAALRGGRGGDDTGFLRERTRDKVTDDFMVFGLP